MGNGNVSPNAGEGTPVSFDKLRKKAVQVWAVPVSKKKMKLFFIP